MGKERYTIPLTCADCQTEGRAKVAETEHSYVGSQSGGFWVEHISDGFVVSKGDFPSFSTEFSCDNCKNVVWPKHPRRPLKFPINHS